MRFDLREVDDRVDFNYGDLLVFKCGKKVLVSKDHDGTDYVGFILDDNIRTDCRMSKEGLLNELRREHNLTSLVRVIKSDNLKLMEL